MKTICYHHNDADGRLSAMIVVKEFGKDVELKEVNYGDKWELDDTINNRVIVVDFSFPNMQELAQVSAELIWIDHHKSAMDKQPDAWTNDKIYGIRNIEDSGCMLTWAYFNYLTMTPEVVNLINDWDTWQFKLSGTKEFHEMFDLTIGKNNIKDFINILDKSNSIIVSDWIISGGVLLRAKEKRVRQAYENGFTGTLRLKEREIDNVRFINSNNDISDIGQYCYEEKTHTIGLIWSYREKHIVVSLRSKIIDVSEIAKSFGGGGHTGSAGMTLSTEQMIQLGGIENGKTDKFSF